MIRASRLLPAATLIALAAAACGGHAAAPPNDAEALGVASPGPGGGYSGPSADPYATPIGSRAAPAYVLQDTFTEDDMKTFVYAFDDAATLAAETTVITKTAQSLSASVTARNYDAAKSYAQQLLGQAIELEGSAATASDRLRPLGPSDGTLIQARKDGLVTFDLAAEYAAAATDLAEAGLALDARAAASVARQASSLLGTTGQLTSSYAALTNQLEGWASANPSAAAKAIAEYA
jgi:hypothetical protein